jgi:hypothetical protein
VVENGQWFKDKIGAIATREMLFEAGAEIAGVLVPGGGLAAAWRRLGVKVIEKMTHGASAAWRLSAPQCARSFARSRAIDWLCSWQIRDSVTPSTAAISFRFMSCS